MMFKIDLIFTNCRINTRPAEFAVSAVPAVGDTV